MLTSHMDLLELVATGELPAHTMDGEPRIPTDRLLTYQRELDAKRLQVPNELTAPTAHQPILARC